jgi:hypothetical protein
MPTPSRQIGPFRLVNPSVHDRQLDIDALVWKTMMKKDEKRFEDVIVLHADAIPEMSR